MPFLIALLAIAAGAYFWMSRAKAAAEMTHELADAAQTVLGAARRFRFRQQANRHPVDCIEDPKIAIAAMATAFLELDPFPTAELKRGLVLGLQSGLDVPLDEAEELVVLGHWMVTQCGGASAAVSRLARRLNKIGAADGLTRSMGVIKVMAKQHGNDLGPRQIEALDEIKRIFRIA